MVQVHFTKAFLYFVQLTPQVLFHPDRDIILLDLYCLFFRVAVKIDPQVVVHTRKLLVDLVASADQILFGRFV